MAQETQTEARYQPKGVRCEGDKSEVQKGGNICIPIADSCWGLTENSKIRKAIILQLKINKLKKKN